MKMVISKGAGFSLSAKALLFLIEKNSSLVKHSEKLDDCAHGLSLDELNFSRVDGSYSPDILAVYFDARYEIIKIVSKMYTLYLTVAETGLYSYRSDPDLIDMVKALGDKACGIFTYSFKIVEVPDDIDLEISETASGDEFVRQKSPIWS